MSGKFALFFLVAVCLVQGYQSRVVEPRDLIEDAVEAIKNILKKIEVAIPEITRHLPDIIKKLDDKIKYILAYINVDQTIQIIKDSIQGSVDFILAINGVHAEDVKDCMEAIQAAEQQLTEDVTAGYAACKQTAEDEVAQLTKEMTELNTRADILIKGSTESIKQCIDEHGIDVVEVGKCLKEYSTGLKADADALIEQIRSTITVGSDKLVKVPIALRECNVDVNNYAPEKMGAIIDDFMTCVKAQ